MDENNTKDERNAFERAAKYICTAKCGLCPMVVENFPCPNECNLDTKAWECWVAYFRSAFKKTDHTNNSHN